MQTKISSDPFQIYNKSCIGLSDTESLSVHALATDPPYGIGYQNHEWDKSLPDKKIWKDSLRVLRPGAFGVVFSSVRLMHRMMVNIEDAGFIIKDVLFWVYLNGMPKSRDISLDIDKILGQESEIVGTYQYVQGYKKGGADNYYSEEGKPIRQAVSNEGKFYKGSGLGIKPAYEPIILIQKPIEAGLTVAQNVVKYGTGALNLEETRLPYEKGESPVGHNPHEQGRVTSNILRTDEQNDGFDKFFVVPKVRQNADKFNNHPTLKPVELMSHLVKLISFKNQTVLDPFMGSGSTGVACLNEDRAFEGYEITKEYFEISTKRLQDSVRKKSSQLF